MRFELTIEMGNEAMQDCLDISAALFWVSQEMERIGGKSDGLIRDDNGNTVGRYAIVED